MTGYQSKRAMAQDKLAQPEQEPDALELPNIIDAVEVRRDAYGLTQKNWAFVLGVQPSHYSEFINGKRRLPVAAMARCFEHGVPAECLFQCRPNKDIRDIKTKLRENT